MYVNVLSGIKQNDFKWSLNININYSNKTFNYWYS